MNSSEPFLISAALIGNLCASVFMTGIVGFIQIVQYPLLNNVSSFDFSCYYKKYISRIAWIVYPVMIIEICFASWLSFLPVQSTSQIPILSTYILLAASTLITFLIQIPLNQKLQLAFNPVLLSKISFYNRIRLISWALRTLILCWIILLLQ